ncbi:MAG: FIG01122401: hypothetical protein, partial [uncultured Rubrobacteraceae bacterium]
GRVAERVARGEQGKLGRARADPHLRRVLRRRLLRGRWGAPAALRGVRGRRRYGQGPPAPPVPLRDGHPELGPPRRPRHGPGLLRPGRRGGRGARRGDRDRGRVRAIGRLRGRRGPGRANLRRRLHRPGRPELAAGHGRVGRGGRLAAAPRRAPLRGRVPPLHGGVRGRGPDGGARLLPLGGARRLGRARHLRRPRGRDGEQRHLRVEAPPGRGGERGGLRGPERRTLARARPHHVPAVAVPGRVRAPHLPPPRGESQAPADVLAPGPQDV